MSGIRDQSIEKYLLEPLEVLFTPLGGEKRHLYLDALKRMTDTQLRGAYEHLRDNYEFTRFPTIAEIFKASKSNSRQSHNENHQHHKNQWEIRSEQREKIIADYVNHFRNSRLALEAYREGWSWPLEQYVHAVASVQAQMIFPGCGIGWLAGPIFGYGNIPDIDAKRAALFEECSKQAQTGHIHIMVLEERIEYWRTHVVTKKPITALNELPIENLGHIKKQLDSAQVEIKSALMSSDMEENNFTSTAYKEDAVRMDAEIVF